MYLRDASSAPIASRTRPAPVGSHASQSRLRSAADVAKMVGNIRFLTLVKPVLHVLPEVAQPDRKIPFKARLPA